MNKYTCSICGYVYNETVGDPERGIAPGTKWEDVTEDWECPLCGATKDEFDSEKKADAKQEQNSHPQEHPLADEEDIGQMHELSFGELSALCSNLAKGCEKQYRSEEAELFNKLSEYFKSKAKPVEDSSFQKLISMVQKDLESGYPQANKHAAGAADRGALRALTWGEKVTKILSSLQTRYEKLGSSMLESTNVYVCEICGFIYVGNEAPEICPVCKVPKFKITQVQRR